MKEIAIKGDAFRCYWGKEIEEAVIAGAHFGQKNITCEL